MRLQVENFAGGERVRLFARQVAVVKAADCEHSIIQLDEGVIIPPVNHILHSLETAEDLCQLNCVLDLELWQHPRVVQRFVGDAFDAAGQQHTLARRDTAS